MPYAELYTWLHVRNYRERTSLPDSSLTKAKEEPIDLEFDANSTPIP